jgi:hypothetical protein
VEEVKSRLNGQATYIIDDMLAGFKQTDYDFMRFTTPRVNKTSRSGSPTTNKWVCMGSGNDRHLDTKLTWTSHQKLVSLESEIVNKVSLDGRVLKETAE